MTDILKLQFKPIIKVIKLLRKLGLLIIFTVFINTVEAQITPDQSTAKSIFNSFSAKAGDFQLTETFEIGKVKMLNIEAIRIKSLINDKVVNGLSFIYINTNPHFSDRIIGTLDFDEIDDLIKVFKYISEKALTIVPFEMEAAYNYYSRGGVIAGASFDTKRKQWNVYIQIETNGKKNLVSIDPKDLPKLMDLISQAKAKLQ